VTDLLDLLLEQLHQLPLWALLAVVGAMMAMETTMLVGIVVPGDLVVLFAAATVDTPLELVLLVVMVTMGTLVGETVGYGLGRRWGPGLRSSRIGRRLGEERWARADDFLERRGGRAVFAARYLAAIHAVTPVVAGTLGMRYRRFITWCAAGGLTWSTLYVAVGAAAGASYRRYSDMLGTATWVVLGALAGAALVIGAKHLRRRRPTQQDRFLLPFGLELREAGGTLDRTGPSGSVLPGRVDQVDAPVDAGHTPSERRRCPQAPAARDEGLNGAIDEAGAAEVDHRVGLGVHHLGQRRGKQQRRGNDLLADQPHDVPIAH
jgi:membrane protein DedA with SNARE-associated domain